MGLSKDNLVLCNNDFTTETTEFSIGTPYRSLDLSEGDNRQYMVYGCVFDKQEFDQKFKNMYEVVMLEWVKLGLVSENYQPISKRKFLEYLDIHSYGKGKVRYLAGYLGIPKKCLYQIHGRIGESMKSFKESAYQQYLFIVQGNMHPFDSAKVVRGNSGIPISYSDIRWKKY